MAGKYGADSVFCYVDGYNLIAPKLTGLTAKAESVMEETTGLGDTWREHTPTGLETGEFTQEGAFWDTAALQSHAALSGVTGVGPQGTARVITLGFAGDAANGEFFAYQAFQSTFDVVATVGELNKVNADYAVTGPRETGIILQPLAVQTADWDTESSSYDAGAGNAPSTAGGIGYQQVTAFSGFTGFIGTIRDSADDAVWADLIAFADVTAQPASERATVAGDVDRYLAFSGNVTGTGSITVWAGFVRS